MPPVPLLLFTDVGTTCELCRNSALRTLMPKLNPAVNVEFNAHFLDTRMIRGIVFGWPPA